jgi:hypothetical protein
MLIRLTLLSALFAGSFGALHDQVSYTISPEYFTQMKFRQFGYANFGLPPRLMAAEVGFLGSWWVGLIGGWLVARLGLAELTQRAGWIYTLSAFTLVAAVAMIVGGAGALIGAARARGDLSGWQHWQVILSLRDLPGFVTVAYRHWASYIGGVLGLVVACVYVKKALARMNKEQTDLIEVG